MSGLAVASMLAALCGAAQLAGMVALLQRHPRAGALRPSATAPGAPRPSVFERLGIAVLTFTRGRRGSPPSSPDPLLAKSVGGAAVLGGGLIVFGPLAAAVGACAGWMTPRLAHRKASKARSAGFAQDLPEVVDLLVLALDAGLNIPLAVEAVGRRGTGPLAAEVAVAAREARRGRRLADALEEVAARCGEQVRPLMALLASGERYGVPLAESLDRLAVDVRAARRRQAEEAARRLPVKMLFPLVACILPAFALLTLGPLLVTSFRGIAW